ncbi:MAG TPA: DinB family protein [Pyrinomonadaceae bacterium]|jgi:uncharacterized damage-inducible protein DinB
MTTKEILLKQFTAAYDENGWFVALKNALNNLTAEQAAWKTENLENSIWEILAHLNFYNRAYVERFKGIEYVYPTTDNDETFAGADAVSAEAWQREVEKFERIMTEWRSLLETANETKFSKTVSATNEMLWAVLLSHVNLHNAHHGGQIVVIRKLQGSWDASKGVS